MPRIERYWQRIGENRAVSEDMLRDLPVIGPDNLPLVEVSTRDAVWATWTLDGELLNMNVDNTSDGESDDGEEKKKNKKNGKVADMKEEKRKKRESDRQTSRKI